MTNLILCGGSGTRLWPLSRPDLPKQFLPLIQGRSLFEETIARNLPHCASFRLAVALPQLELAEAQARGLGVAIEGGLLEPAGRNTAPAIALACRGLDPKTIVLVSPSDHIITRADHYDRAVARAAELAAEGKLVTFGLKALRPETGYGYIEAVGEDVVSFHEKPNFETAEAYVRGGRHWWNSGMFVFRAGVFLEELKRHAHDVWEACEAVELGTSRFVRPSLDEMRAIPAVPIDVAVMQRSALVAMVPCDLGWSDLGSFETLFEAAGRPEGDNVVLGSGTAAFYQASGNLVSAETRRVTLMNVENLLVVDTPDELLIAKRGTNPASRENP